MGREGRELKKKLKKKYKKNPDPKTHKIYKLQKCAFHDSDGKRCLRNAVGKSTLCELHGGSRIDLENTHDAEETKALVKSSPLALFLPDKHPIWYIELSQDGKSPVEIASLFKVSISTIKAWSEKYREFAIAYEIGQAMHEAWWLSRGKEGLDSRTFNTSLYKFLTGNKLGYSDKIETKTHNTHTIHGVLLVPDKVSAEQWEEEYVDAEFSDANPKEEELDE